MKTPRFFKDCVFKLLPVFEVIVDLPAPDLPTKIVLFMAMKFFNFSIPPPLLLKSQLCLP